ncbi:hypothetical protein HNQ80_001183 [Anaerosolibacter carboniphilus]|uniref:Uncharacterized protein n=1 Tax=Anaerosolibacter carboniphilus TaxID=1417629 RepID=A0A841KMR6_9FIRM|nr:hypothetical protein [Anaerosolibacter carboniphilus]MBB6215094.1 hypothetical protein [Anaerosolibacter carboniphilus]
MTEKAIWGKVYDSCFSIEISAQIQPHGNSKVEYSAEFIGKNLKEPRIEVRKDIKDLIEAVYAQIQNGELKITNAAKEEFLNDRKMIIAKSIEKTNEFKEEIEDIRDYTAIDKISE